MDSEETLRFSAVVEKDLSGEALTAEETDFLETRIRRFLEELKNKKAPGLRVKTRDLAKNPKNHERMAFLENDLNVSYGHEFFLRFNTVEIPIYRDSTMRPLGIKSKYLDFEAKNHGFGLWTVEQLLGFRTLNANNEQHLRPTIEERRPFYFWFDREPKNGKPPRFKRIFYEDPEKIEEAFQEKLREVEELKSRPEAIRLYFRFEHFYRWYWLDRNTSWNARFGPLNRESTYDQLLDFLQAFDSSAPLLTEYAGLLAAVGDISETSETEIGKQLNRALETSRRYRQTIIEEHGLNLASRADDTRKYFNPETGKQFNLIEQLGAFAGTVLAEIFDPYVWVDAEFEELHPNLGQSFHALQPSPSHRNADSKRELARALIEKSKTQGKKLWFTKPEA